MEVITRQIPETLLYEEFGGRRYYRRGYRQVLSGLKNESEIMGGSVFQSLIVTALIFYFKTILPKKQYWVQSSEAGLHLDRTKNLANDIAIVEKSKLKDPRSLKYNDIPPKFIVEVDIKIDPKDYSHEPAVGSDMDYILQKSEQLLDFGVEGVAWILTPSRKTLLFRPNHGLEVCDWAQEVPIFDGYTFCLKSILEEEGILPDSE